MRWKIGGNPRLSFRYSGPDGLENVARSGTGPKRDYVDRTETNRTEDMTLVSHSPSDRLI